MARNKKRISKRTRNRLIFAGGVIVVLLLLFLLIRALFGLFFSSNDTSSTNTDSNKTVVSFMGVGDNLIHETVYNDAKQNDGTYNFKKMYTNFKKGATNSDISFINQKTVLGGEKLGLSGYPTFNSPTEIAQNLEDTGFNLVNLATNHSLNKGEEGIANELKAFKKNKYCYGWCLYFPKRV